MLDHIVDAHHHLWDLSEVNYPWLRSRGVTRFFGDPTPIQKDYRLDDYRRDIGDLPVTHSVHIQVGADPSDTVAETRWLQSLVDQSSSRMPNAIVAFCDLAADDAEQTLDAHGEFGNVRGIRQIVGRSPDEDATSGTGRLLENRVWCRNLARLPSRQLSFDLQLIPAQLPAIRSILEAIPDLNVALCHCGSPHDQSAEGIEIWREGLSRLAELPNVYCKLSGFSMFEHDWDPERVRRISLVAIEAFGVDRCMFGSNFPVERLYVSYRELYDCYFDILEGFSDAEQAALLAGTATRFYRL